VNVKPTIELAGGSHASVTRWMLVLRLEKAPARVLGVALKLIFPAEIRCGSAKK